MCSDPVHFAIIAYINDTIRARRTNRHVHISGVGGDNVHVCFAVCKVHVFVQLATAQLSLSYRVNHGAWESMCVCLVSRMSKIVTIVHWT